MNPNYPKMVNGKPVYCKMPKKITYRMITQAYKDNLPCKDSLLAGYWVAVCITDMGFLLPGKAKVYKNSDKCEQDCNIANTNNGFTEAEFQEAYNRLMRNSIYQ